MGIGDGGLGMGYWGLGPIPNPQSPIPNPQSPFSFKEFLKTKLEYKTLKSLIDKGNSYTDFKNNIHRKEKVNIIPKKYNNSEELIKELNNKKLYIVNQDLIDKIDIEKKYKEKEIQFSMNKKTFKFIFNENKI